MKLTHWVVGFLQQHRHNANTRLIQQILLKNLSADAGYLFGSFLLLLIVSVVLAYIFGKRNGVPKLIQELSTIRLGEVRNLERLSQSNSQIGLLQSQLEALQVKGHSDEFILKSEMALRAGLEGQIKELVPLKNQLGEMRQRITELERENATLKADLENEKIGSVEKLKVVEGARQELSNSFAAISAKSLETNNVAFVNLANQVFEKFQESAKGDLKNDKKKLKLSLSP